MTASLLCRAPARWLAARLLFAVWIVLSLPAWAVEPFFAPPEPAGRITVKLYPMENVKPGAPTLVTFGLPFTRSSITVADLAKLRVLKDGQEIPAHVEQLTPWRHIADPTIHEKSVRVAAVQFEYTFKVAFPAYEEIVVEWGYANRTKDVPALRDPRAAWHLATSGTFAPEDGVMEPDVYAVLPKSHLCKGAVCPTRMNPLDDRVPEARQAPQAMRDQKDWPAFLKMDQACANFFHTLLNDDDPKVTEENKCHYKTDSEPWLYDRASAMFILYMRSGWLKPLREAVRHAQFYRNNLYPEGTNPARAVGLFKLKAPDLARASGGNVAMYSYNECLAYDYWLTGDQEVLPTIALVAIAHEKNDEPTRWTPKLGGWTERHTAFRLLSNVVAYEVLGDDAYRDNLLREAGDFMWHQDGADGEVPSDRVDGGLYHFGRQHGDGTANELVASPWMSVLTADAMVRAYAVTEDPKIADFLRRLGNFEKAACKTDNKHMYDTYDGALTYCDYMTRWDGSTDERGGSEVEHALEVAGALAWASYFAALTGKPDPSLKDKAAELYATYCVAVDYWTRPTGPDAGKPAFRVTPWRKYGWEYRTSGSFSWLMTQR